MCETQATISVLSRALNTESIVNSLYTVSTASSTLVVWEEYLKLLFIVSKVFLGYSLLEVLFKAFGCLRLLNRLSWIGDKGTRIT